MDRHRPYRLFIAAVAAGIAILVVALGRGLVPTHEIANARGVVPQWLLTWSLVWATALSAAGLAGFLVRR